MNIAGQGSALIKRLFMVKKRDNLKVLLVQAPPWGIYAPPLGIAYLATFLRSRGLESEVYDLNMEIFCSASGEMREKWDAQDFEFWASGQASLALKGKIKEFCDKIISSGARLIGFSATFASVPFVNEVLSVIRANAPDDLVVLIGGGGASYKEGRSLFRKDLIDYFVVGEGEFPLLYLLRNIQEGNSIKACSDYIVWKDENCDRALCLKNTDKNGAGIDDIPFPTFEEFDLMPYTQKDLIPLISSRGCIRRCAFCCDSPLKKPYRSRNPEIVAREIKYHVKKYNRKRFEFSDLLINGDLCFLYSFCDLLIDMRLGVCWGGQATARRDMDVSLFKKMKDAGCGGLTFGVESCSDNVLRLMRKGVSTQIIKETFERAKEAGMLVEINLIVGFPGETEKDVDETIDFIRQNSALIDKINSLNICTIGPGMYIYDHLEEYNIDRLVIRDWYSWFTKDMSNNIETRTDRHGRMLSAFSELDMMPVWQNVKK